MVISMTNTEKVGYNPMTVRSYAKDKQLVLEDADVTVVMDDAGVKGLS